MKVEPKPKSEMTTKKVVIIVLIVSALMHIDEIISGAVDGWNASRITQVK